MALKSLLSQARQIKSSVQQADIDLGADNASRDTLVNGAAFLEEDLNNLRSMVLDITGETKWSDIPAVTLKEAAGAANKLIIQPVQFSSAGVTGTSLVTALDAVAGVTNTTSTTDLGYVVTDEAVPAEGNKAHVSIREAATNMPIVDTNEQKVYAVAYNDGADKVELKFFSNDPSTGDAVAYEFVEATDIEAILPSRTDLATANEEFPMVNAGWADAVGAFELGDRVWVDGVLNDGTTPTYGFVEDEDITTTINKIAAVGINDKNLGDNVSVVSGINSATFTTTFSTDNADSYLADGDTLYAAIEKLDLQAKANADAAASASADKVMEILTADVAEETAIALPQGKTYLNTDKDAMNVYVTGQHLVSDAVADANNAGDLGDYAETSTTEVTFHFPLEIGDVVAYSISKSE
jgi:hypothetical protein